ASAVALGGLVLRPDGHGRSGVDTSQTTTEGRAPSMLDVLRRPEQHRLAVVFAATTLAAGIVVAFLPLAAGSSQSAALALLAQAWTATAGRWVGGRYGDRYGHPRLLVPGLAAAAAGIGALAWTANPAVFTLGAILFGAGFGAVQSSTLAAMLQRV